MDQLDLRAMKAEFPFLLETPFEHRDEMTIHLNGVEAVAQLQMVQNGRRYRAASGTDFEDVARSAWFAQLRDQGTSQKTATGHNRAGVTKMPPTLAEEVAAFRPIFHPRCLATQNVNEETH